MHMLACILTSYEDRDPAQTPSADRVPEERDSSQRSFTLSLRLEMKDSGRPRAVQAGEVTDQPPARSVSGRSVSGRRASGDGRLGWLRRAWRGIAERAQLPPSGAGQPPQPEQGAGGHPGMSSPSTVSFWEALTPAEQEALSSVASFREFAPGHRLMGEGDQADYVMVIIDGRTRVCVDENGWERVLAERGPGQLIGERGGLQVRVRSASVIALEAVRVLMVGTEDFTAFVNAHPRVFDIVESQLYDRLTQAPAEATARGGPGGAKPVPDRARPAAARAIEDTTSAPRPLTGQNCTVLFSDVVAFSSHARTDDDRLVIRRALLEMTVLVLQGIVGVWSQDRGDGLLTVIPPGVPTANVVTLLHTRLPVALDRHNSSGRDSTRFRLRIAVNVGPVTSDTQGVSGEAIIIAARLLEAPVFKKAIAGNTANLGIIASPFVYDTVIRHTLNPSDLAGYSQVKVDVKEAATAAWMKLFGVPVAPSYYSPPPASDSFGAALTTYGWCPSAGLVRLQGNSARER